MTRKVTIDNILEYDTELNQNLLVVSYRIFFEHIRNAARRTSRNGEIPYLVIMASARYYSSTTGLFG